MYWTSFGVFGGVTISTSEVWTDGSEIFRLQVRGLYLNLDQAMTATGFNGTQGVDWDVIKSTRY